MSHTFQITELTFGKGSSNLSNVELSEGLSTIPYNAFNGCGNLTNLDIPDTVTSIGDQSFAYCGITHIDLPPVLVSIGKWSFYGCGGLSSLTIPSGVITVGYAAFAACYNLKSTFFLGQAPTMENYVFSYAYSNVVYYLPSASGFTSPAWQGWPCFIAAPYGGIIPNSSINEAHLIGGAPADGNVMLGAAVTNAPLLWQRQTTPVTLDMESSRILRLGATGTVRVEAGGGVLNIGKSVSDGFLTAGGAANSPGTLVLDNASTNDITVNAVIANNGSGAVGLSKTSIGRAILNASNTYSGNTTVTGGTLTLKLACLADSSIVWIANGANLKLDYNGTDIVTGLTLGGIAKANGTYDSTNSNGLITGTGKIQVGPFANYTAWASAIAPGQTGNQDYDNDGVPNSVEYFMGITGNGITPNPGITLDGTVTWPKGAGFVGSYAVEVSTDLMEWTDVSNDPAQVTHYSDSIIWTRPPGAGNRFVRLAVMSN